MTKTSKSLQVYGSALKIFARYGYSKATLADIAGEMGMTKQALYFYASNKRDLYRKTVSFALKRWQSGVKEKIAGIENAREAFIAMCTTAVDHLSQDTDLRTVLMNDPAIFPLSSSEDPFHDINRESMDILRDILKRGIEQGVFRPCDVDLTTEFIFSIYVMYIIKLYIKPESGSARAMFNEGLEHILRGISA